MLWDFVLWDFVLWDFVRRDSVLWDFVLWDFVPDSVQLLTKCASTEILGTFCKFMKTSLLIFRLRKDRLR